MSQDVLITRDSTGTGTTGGKPNTGRVYIVDVYGDGYAFSSTKDPRKATRFTEPEARAIIKRVRSWRDARTVFAATAKRLEGHPS